LSEEKQGILAGFKEFLMRGNVVELAVAVVIGAAFTKIVNSVVQGVINPVVGTLGTKDLKEYEFCLKAPCTVNAVGDMEGIPIQWGLAVSASLTFLITAAVVCFCMILPVTKYKARLAARKPVDGTPPPKTELELLAEIRDTLVAQRTVTGMSTGPTVGPQRDQSDT
jgi:large conductance mechanosensitive channel